MELTSREFITNSDPLAVAEGIGVRRLYTWDPNSRGELALILTTASYLEDMGWFVGIESPLPGVQRSLRIPIIAFKMDVALLVKPVSDSKKVNPSGLKLLDIQVSLKNKLKQFEIRPIVYAYLDEFDAERKTSQNYEVWIKGQDGLSN